MKARALAVLGTGSDVGKSLITAGLCRLFLRAGVRVAPFKAQNMSNNSYVTPDGKEIGRAQALQAQACGLDPDADMNPILMKPESDRSAQIVVQGQVWGKAEARTYFERRAELAERVRESYERLANQHDLIVIEGAGSAAEMNLRDRDLANWFAVGLADARVVLVADIDRGGVFAQVIGTLDLLAPPERARVIGIIINKFRGDATLFDDGVRFIEQRTGLPVLGVVPMLRDLILDQEDSLEIDRARQAPFAPDRINIAVVLLPRMSNFTDVRRLAAEEDVILRYAAEPRDLAGADIIVIPGTKNTIGDLRYLREAGFPEVFREHVEQGRELLGLCGGYQMLGRSIADPEGGGVRRCGGGTWLAGCDDEDAADESYAIGRGAGAACRCRPSRCRYGVLHSHGRDASRNGSPLFPGTPGRKSRLHRSNRAGCAGWGGEPQRSRLGHLYTRGVRSARFPASLAEPGSPAEGVAAAGWRGV